MPPIVTGQTRNTAYTANRYVPFGGGGSAGSATENLIGRQVHIAGTFFLLSVNADNVGTTRVVQLRKNSANANLVVNPTDTTAGVYNDSIHTDHYANTDLLDCFINATGSPTYYYIRAVFQSDAGHGAQYALFSSNAPGVSTSWGQALGGAAGFGAGSEAAASAVVRVGGTVSFMFVILAVASTSIVTVQFRKNLANGNQTFTVGTGVTGYFEDASNTDSIVSGDAISIQLSGQSAAAAFGGGTCVAWSVNSNDVICSAAFPGVTFTASATPAFNNLWGTFGVAATESNVASTHGFAGSCSNARIYFITNTYATNVTVQLRINGANGNQAITVTFGVTGLFEDVTNTDNFKPTDTMNFSIVGGTAGAGAMVWSALTETPLLLMGQTVM